MKYTSTRDTSKEFSASEAIVKGISDDGGLFVPSSFPHLDGSLMDSLLKMDYQERKDIILPHIRASTATTPVPWSK